MFLLDELRYIGYRIKVAWRRACKAVRARWARWWTWTR